MKNISKPLAIAWLIIICLAFQVIFYADVSIKPNQYLFSSTGDGISSYYNSAYHIEHDSSYLHFQGMNFPFGEHLTYSVNNPLLTNTLKFFDAYFPSISDYTVGIINFSMLISFFLLALFLFFIFEELKINRLLSVSASFGIMFLSPQIFRMLGHLSLAYSFVIPMTIWFLMRNFREKKAKKWFIILLINQLIWIFVHPYYTAIGATLFLSFSLVHYFLSSENRKVKLFYGFKLAFIAIAPILAYKFFVAFTDFHSCRTDNPYGFLSYTSAVESVFIPHHPSIKPFLNEIIIINQEWEGWAYLGLGSIITLILAAYYLLKQKRKESVSFRDNVLFDNQLLNILLISAHLVFLFSMGLPFKIVPGYVPDFLSFLKEFRSLGRFAWLFYFIITIYCTYLINKYIQTIHCKKGKWKPYFIIALFSGLFVVEGYSYHHEVSQSIIATPNYFKSGDNLGIDSSLGHIKLSEYQAIMPLPFYHSGSENFTKSPSGKILLYSEILSFKSKLPLISSYLARTSIGESKQLLQLVSPAEFDKPVKSIFPNDKDILVLFSKENLSESEFQILQRSELLIDNHEFGLYKLRFDSLFKVDPKVQNDDSKPIVYEDFENFSNQFAYRGNGSFSGQLGHINIIYQFNPEAFKKGETYSISFWMYNCGNNCGQDRMNSVAFIEYEDITGHIEWLSVVNPSNSLVIDGCWSKVELLLFLDNEKPDPSKIKLIVKGNERLATDLLIDEMRVEKLNSNQN